MDQRTEVVSTKLTPAEKEALRYLAFYAKKSLSTFIRDVLIEKAGLEEAASFYASGASGETKNSIADAVLLPTA
jgi:hypothetical protein